MKTLSIRAKAFIGLVLLAGSAILVNRLLLWKAADWPEFVALLMIAIGASRLKVTLPGILDDEAVSFYKHFSFEECPTSNRQFMIPMQDVRRAKAAL